MSAGNGLGEAKHETGLVTMRSSMGRRRRTRGIDSWVNNASVSTDADGRPWQANSNDNTHSVFSNEDVDNARVGSQMYGFKRYSAAISPSLASWDTALLVLHICTRAHAATASLAVHSRGAVSRDNGNTVEKSDNNRGECRKEPPEYGSTPCWKR